MLSQICLICEHYWLYFSGFLVRSFGKILNDLGQKQIYMGPC